MQIVRPEFLTDLELKDIAFVTFVWSHIVDCYGSFRIFFEISSTLALLFYKTFIHSLLVSLLLITFLLKNAFAIFVIFVMFTKSSGFMQIFYKAKSSIELGPVLRKEISNLQAAVRRCK